MNERRARGKVDLSEMRANNERMLLRLIWSNPGTTRAEISRSTGLSASTVSGIVSRFESDGLVHLRPSRSSSGGRPPVLLNFDDEHLHVIGVDMGASHVTSVLATPNGEIIAECEVDNESRDNPESTLEAIEHTVRECVSDAGLSGAIVGLGLAVPCPVDLANPGQLSELILPKWSGLDVVEELRSRVGLPVYVENDANAGALAELWFGAGTEHFAYVKVGTGIGSGHVIDGRLYRGAGGIAGELGHVSIATRGDGDVGGNLNDAIGTPTLLARAAHKCQGPVPRTSTELAAAARAGQPWAEEIVRELAGLLSVGVAGLVNILNPEKVIFGGQIVHTGSLFLDAIESAVRSRSLILSNNQAEFALTSLGTSAIALGAATLPLEAGFNDHELFRTASLGRLA